MNKDELKSLLCEAVDVAEDNVREYARDIETHPELGFAEERTSKALSNRFKALGLKVRENIAITGIRTDIYGGYSGPKVALMGELDGIICRKYPTADPVTGASHACGHNLQTSIILAAAAALAKTGAMKYLSGSVALMGVPAEEFIEIAHRSEMREKGEITYMCGKPEFVRLGEMDDVDMSMMIHAGEDRPGKGFTVPDYGNGFRVFMLQYKGRQAHAAAAAHDGVNALYAAVVGINGVNALRETFRDEDRVRVHYIITKGGDSANCVPDDVRMEGYVRAVNAECIDTTFDKVVRAFKAGGESLGAQCLVSSIPGDMPLKASKELNEVFSTNAVQLVGEENVTRGATFTASSDMGDITHIMPAIHPMSGGVSGALHSEQFRVEDFKAAVLIPAKVLLMTTVDLLFNGAAEARGIMGGFKPVYTKEEYLAAMDRRFYSEVK